MGGNTYKTALACVEVGGWEPTRAKSGGGMSVDYLTCFFEACEALPLDLQRAISIVRQCDADLDGA